MTIFCRKRENLWEGFTVWLYFSIPTAEPKLWEIKNILHFKFKKFGDDDQISQDQISEDQIDLVWENLWNFSIGEWEAKLEWEALAGRDYHWLSFSRWSRLSLIISKDYNNIIIFPNPLFTITFFLFCNFLKICKPEMILSEFSRKSRLGQRNVSGLLQPSTEIGPMTT